jgi:hypothetical protein
LPLPDPAADPLRAEVVQKAYALATERTPAPVMPVYYRAGEADRRSPVRPVYIIFGTPLPAGVSLDEVREAVRQLGADFCEESYGDKSHPKTLAQAH